jgi:argininosuccinate lyase
MEEGMTEYARPMWDRGESLDAQMMRFTIGDDWRHDRRLVEHDVAGSIAHAEGLVRAGLVSAADGEAIRAGLEGLLADWRAGAWNVEPTDEDVHSALERRLVERIGDAGKRLHTARSRNEQVVVCMRLWLRGAVAEMQARALELVDALRAQVARHGGVFLPGYTHLRRAMPSTVGDWAGAHQAAFEDDARDFDGVSRRIALCPLGTGSGYGLPVELDRAFVAQQLGFEGPEEPVTRTQNARGRAELAYLTVLEGLALDLGKLAADLWLFTTEEFGFAALPQALTTGSSLMPQKRNPDLIELLRGHARQAAADRAALLEVVRDLPSGYHRDFQLAKEPLFRGHDRALAMLPLAARVVRELTWREDRLQALAADPSLRATERALERVRDGVPFRDAYRMEAREPDGSA